METKRLEPHLATVIGLGTGLAATVRVLAIGEFDSSTAAAILASSTPSDLSTTLMMSMLDYVVPLIAVVWWHQHRMPIVGAPVPAPVGIVCGLVAVPIAPCFWLIGTWLVLPSLLRRPDISSAQRRPRHVRWIESVCHRAGRSLVIRGADVTQVAALTTSFGLLGAMMLLEPIWLPRETFQVGNRVVIGAALERDGQDVVVLEERRRTIVRLPDRHITSRHICRTQQTWITASIPELIGHRYGSCG